MICFFIVLSLYYNLPPNGERYLRVGGTRQRHFGGTDSKPHNLPENAVTPTRRVHAVLGGSLWSDVAPIVHDILLLHRAIQEIILTHTPLDSWSLVLVYHLKFYRTTGSNQFLRYL